MKGQNNATTVFASQYRRVKETNFLGNLILKFIKKGVHPSPPIGYVLFMYLPLRGNTPKFVFSYLQNSRLFLQTRC